MAERKQKIIPHLWFDRQAEEAARLYTSLFKSSKMGTVTRATKAGFDIHGLPEGTVMTVEFELAGQAFAGINGGPLFKFNPSVSFLVPCTTKEEVDELYDRLSAGGPGPLMELGEYPFSARYAWTQDKFGLSWQIMFSGDRKFRQKILPALFFVGAQAGRAEEALRLYTSIFPDSGIGETWRYGPGEDPEKPGTIKHAVFTLEGQEFAATDSAGPHAFTFNEAISLMRVCETQAEIDAFWNKLTANGGQESMCGWLKDKFGVSWQIAPAVLQDMLHDRDTKKVERVTDAFLKMKKFDIETLKKAFRG